MPIHLHFAVDRYTQHSAWHQGRLYCFKRTDDFPLQLEHETGKCYPLYTSYKAMGTEGSCLGLLDPMVSKPSTLLELIIKCLRSET